MHVQKPAKYLVLIESGGAMVARLFDAQRSPLAEIDATSEEVAVMTEGVVPRRGAEEDLWGRALAGHSREEREAALVFELDP